MARKAKPKPAAGKSVETLRHREARRRNIPTAEYQSVIQKEAEQPYPKALIDDLLRQTSAARRRARRCPTSSGTTPSIIIRASGC